MEVSGRRHAQAALYHREKDHRYAFYRRLCGPGAGLEKEVRGKISFHCRGSNLDPPVIQSVARH
jgi:hypothetical protein